VLRETLTAGYTGPLSLEVFNDVFRAADPDRMAVDAMRSLLVLEDELPAPAPLDGYAFVELGLDSTTAPEAEATLEALGFGGVRVVVRDDGPGITALGLATPEPDKAAARAEALLAPSLLAPDDISRWCSATRLRAPSTTSRSPNPAACSTRRRCSTARSSA
jgi:4-hydroxyphenylpyruvate dioxygenase